MASLVSDSKHLVKNQHQSIPNSAKKLKKKKIFQANSMKPELAYYQIQKKAQKRKKLQANNNNENKFLKISIYTSKLSSTVQ